MFDCIFECLARHFGTFPLFGLSVGVQSQRRTCFTICSAICLCISPDSDGNRGTKIEAMCQQRTIHCAHTSWGSGEASIGRFSSFNLSTHGICYMRQMWEAAATPEPTKPITNHQSLPSPPCVCLWMQQQRFDNRQWGSVGLRVQLA
jgi:hypothetical protein